MAIRGCLFINRGVEMDIYAKKIIDFLQKNPNLDLEVADIAFHLKMDEQFVHNYMSSLLRQEIVINRRNEYGRIYWYCNNKQENEVDIPVMEIISSSINSASEKTSSVIDCKNSEIIPEVQEKKKLNVYNWITSILIIALCIMAYSGYVFFEQKMENLNKTINSIHQELIKISEINRNQSKMLLKIEKYEAQVKNFVLIVDSLKTILEEQKHNQINNIKTRRPVVKKRK